jgi:hypothetical protein
MLSIEKKTADIKKEKARVNLNAPKDFMTVGYICNQTAVGQTE